MRKTLFSLLLTMAFIPSSFGKMENQLDNFYSAETSTEYTGGLTGETIRVEMLLPREFRMINKHQKMPLFVVFDEQNQANYKNTLNTIDYLTTLSTIPSSCILGIGFNDGMQRFNLSHYSGEKVSLDPFLKDLKQLIENQLINNEIDLSNIILIGHSRTGYVASQFLFNYPTFITAAIVGSAQDISSENEKAIFENFLKTIEDQKLKRYFFFSSGKEKWGDADEQQTTNLIQFFEKSKKSTRFITKAQQFNCDHYNSLGYGLNGFISDFFQGHNWAMQQTFELLNSGSKLTYSSADYAAIYNHIADSTGIWIERDITFYVSLFYGYLNDYSGQYKDHKLQNAEHVLQEAIERFPNDFRYVLHQATLLIEQGKVNEAKSYFDSKTNLFSFYTWKNEQALLDELQQFDELFEH